MNIFSVILKPVTFLIFILFVIHFEFLNGYEIGLSDNRDSASEASLYTLHFVAVIARHGTRAPLFTYPNDPYPFSDKRFWPHGKGELTNAGKQQLYSLGAKLRGRYSGFLPLVYYPNDTTAMYNPLNRDFDSVACLLAALYPPVGEEIWNQELMWQPVPARVYDFDICEMIKNDKCPEFKSEAMQSMKAYNDKVAQNTSCILSYVSNHTGSNLTRANQLFDITDTLIMQEENGFMLEEWTKSVYPKELKENAVQLLNALYAGSDKILSLTAGPELLHINELFSKKINGILPENSKLYIELGHDCILYSLLKAMGSPLADEMVETSSHMTFELHRLYSSYIVQVFFYKNHTVNHPTFIDIEECPSPCSLDNFEKFIQKVAGTESWSNACKQGKKT